MQLIRTAAGFVISSKFLKLPIGFFGKQEPLFYENLRLPSLVMTTLKLNF